MASLPTPEYTFEPADHQRIAASTSPVSLVKHETIASDPLQLWTNMGAVIPGTA